MRTMRGNMKQAIPNVVLDTGLLMPVVGQGVVTHEVLGAGQIQTMVEQAVAVGHRRFDSAPGEREAELGNALRNKIADGTVEYSEIFIVSKVPFTHRGKVKLRESLVSTLKNIGQSYLSLLLLNSPCAIKEDGTQDDEVYLTETWQTMEELHAEGLVKAIGVANFNKYSILEILAHCKVRPAVLEIECHPYFVDSHLIEFCRSKDIHVTAVGPFGFPCRPSRDKHETKLLDDPVIVNLAERKGKTPAQIVLRYLLQLGVSIVTRGKVPDQQTQNITFFDMVLSDRDEAQIAALNKMERRMRLENLENHKDYPFHHRIK